MTARPLDPKKISPCTAVMFDLLAAGEPVSMDRLRDAGASALLKTDPALALRRGRHMDRNARTVLSDEALTLKGARDLARNSLDIQSRPKSNRLVRVSKTECRMLPHAIAEWRAARPHLQVASPTGADSAPAILLTVAPTTRTAMPNPYRQRVRPVAPALPANLRYTSDRHFNDIHEDEGWYYAPLSAYSLVHFHYDEAREFPLDKFKAELPDGFSVEHDDMTGLYRVYGRAGQDDRDNLELIIESWCETNNIKVKGRRTEKDAKFLRDITDLPPVFWAELCTYYGGYTMRIVRRHMSSIRVNVSEYADIEQYAYLWVIRAARSYDHTRGVPFGAWLTKKVPAWAQDLGRSRFGRTAYDIELTLKRTISAFTTEHGRNPRDTELAEIMGVSLATIRKNTQTVSTMDNLRVTSPIDLGPDATQIPLAAAGDPTESILDDTDQTELSAALTASCSPDQPEGMGKAAMPNVLGWASWYFTTWGGMNKQDLTETLGTSHRHMQTHTEKSRERMQEALADR